MVAVLVMVVVEAVSAPVAMLVVAEVVVVQ
jgi:hypothetical protein